MTQQRQESSATLRDYLHVILLRKWLVIGLVVVFTLVAGAYSLSKPKLYEASARLMYAPPADIANPSVSTSSTDINTLTLQLQSVGNTLADPDVTKRARDAVSGDLGDLQYSVTATVVTPSSASSSGSAIADSVDVTVLATSSRAASVLANAYAAAIITQRMDRQQASFRAAQAVVQQQLDLLKASQSQASPEYATLSLQLRNLQIAEAAANGDFVVIKPATRPSSPASPRPVRSAVMGFAAGLFFGIVLAFVVGQFDTRVRGHREAGELLGLSVVGRIPRMSRHSVGEEGLVTLSEPNGVVSESLRVLRRNLEWSRIDGPLRSLVFTSCSKGDGKTLTLCNLAVTLARAGSNVIIVDADLRNPQVHRVFGLRSSVGLTSVAVGTKTLADALVEFKAAARSATVITTSRDAAPPESATWDGSLRILATGPVPPNPGEVAASRSVAAIFSALAEFDVDYVLVDTPPLLAFGDAGALASSVDGLVMVTNLAKARRPALEDGRDILDSLPCRKVGLVVVGEPHDDARYSTYSSYSSGRQRP